MPKAISPITTPPARAHDGEWQTMQHWINRASRDIGGTNAVCFDAKDRRCFIGSDFQRAHGRAIRARWGVDDLPHLPRLLYA